MANYVEHAARMTQTLVPGQDFDDVFPRFEGRLGIEQQRLPATDDIRRNDRIIGDADQSGMTISGGAHGLVYLGRANAAVVHYAVQIEQ